MARIFKTIRYNLSSPRSKFEQLLNEACINNAGRPLERIWEISNIGESSSRIIVDVLFEHFGESAISNDIETARGALKSAIIELTEIAASAAGTEKYKR